MNYADAIVWLKEHDVKKDDGTYYEFGEVSLFLLCNSTIGHSLIFQQWW